MLVCLAEINYSTVYQNLCIEIALPKNKKLNAKLAALSAFAYSFA